MKNDVTVTFLRYNMNQLFLPSDLQTGSPRITSLDYSIKSWNKLTMRF